LRATKSVLQPFYDERVSSLLYECLTLTYNALHYAEENGIENRKGMRGFYGTLKGAKLPSCYKVAAITRACAVLKSRRKSQRRGVSTEHPKPLRPAICIISGFFITAKGRLFIPLERDRYVDVQLNRHVQEKLARMELRSLTVTQDAISFCYSDDVKPLPSRSIYGIDRNEKNLTFGNRKKVVQIDLSRTVSIRQRTREILSSFKRNDARVRRKLSHKYWRRAGNRTNQILHAATNLVVDYAVENGATLALEDLKGIRKMYRKGSGQGSDYRFRMNSWPYSKAYHMLEYKSLWRGITVIPLTKADTHGSSSVHSACGKRLHGPLMGDAVHRRMQWCQSCKVWVDRDANAVVVLSDRGLARFASSLPRPEGRPQQALKVGEEGLAGEAMKGNGPQTLILRVDASKLLGGSLARNGAGHGPES
jgi:putative transposase